MDGRGDVNGIGARYTKEVKVMLAPRGLSYTYEAGQPPGEYAAFEPKIISNVDTTATCLLSSQSKGTPPYRDFHAGLILIWGFLGFDNALALVIYLTDEIV